MGLAIDWQATTVSNRIDRRSNSPDRAKRTPRSTIGHRQPIAAASIGIWESLGTRTYLAGAEVITSLFDGALRDRTHDARP
jgi:hypothetical protein